ncbi:hypothetical protein [Fulvivirga sediminis]|uniref:Uncharacterized protein n=1 Tax=Fulvivirga sediminis TaxID=2803949 RepID=A0A937F7G8_9BACT|nr:hypothetical protein [Fulvivirga sediminis]MBL3656024.1 hypothetical protein [Fulvivirga sediminis]
MNSDKSSTYTKLQLQNYLHDIDSLTTVYNLNIIGYSDIKNNLKDLADIERQNSYDSLLIQTTLTFLRGKVLDAMYDEIFDGHTALYVLQVHCDKAHYQVGDTAKVILALSQKMYTNFEITDQILDMTYAEGIEILNEERIGDCLYASFLIKSPKQGFIHSGFIFQDIESGYENNATTSFGFN